MKRWWLFLLLCSTLIPPHLCRRGGGGGFGRGSSGSRMGGGLSKSSGRTSGGFGSSGGHSSHSGAGLFSGHKNTGGHQTSSGGTGFIGTNNMGRKPQGTGFNRGDRWNAGDHYRGGHRGNFQTSRYTSSGTGSFLRSNQFKNMIVGAAAGYLTYQAGKHIIRSMAAPMMWHSRPYYWGQSYYQPHRGYTQMCRMPIQPNDPQFGNIYLQDQVSRPHELVWGCGAYEVCCGMECCHSGASPQQSPFTIGRLDYIGHRNW
ncbi:unnamed protein product, partial [Mesorhabditis belari]|uniref:CX domain-containing protein n=1 Tax=Mesorhabditis belari TaxID=2138241 RepID=A0AAF3J1F5_9BILA